MERRRHERIQFNGTHLCTKIKISKINGIPINHSHEGHACIYNISNGGAGLRTNLDFPVNDQVHFELDLEARLIQPLRLRAKIVWKQGNHYGCEFVFDDQAQATQLSICLSDATVFLQTNDVVRMLVQCNFCRRTCELMKKAEKPVPARR
ncbi:PilZ domain-containing protein [Heliophilum fasciatum]|uniref:PilZ domain-containing protein n=1 Tax=Heliophilum fasciatum TaxID=35700 RepID=A0A4R2RS28_9FIRM|nr:PilZ domain-containing protein [Heliophilum fasciatum]MCW2278597.1 hypothetical protein [Heliophilum fasciatum]TCP62701.1 PilZ domain-containing protein [Heliophilum fasciatum]